MAKPFGVDLVKLFGVTGTVSQSQIPTATPQKRQGSRVGRPGLPPTVRGLPWSKMLQSFREKSS